ncbi:MAG: peptidase M16 [Zetaproteobacteria bacterium CG_4_9_14_3_um_filter_49_83]|nr:MAG: peptidase M16 [Zetaproteobacteria bacterium CG1_02_49_23]PIQ34936.1 MAG: peptidase M16 [Zetaproteobacteria bacterium CG17_big_fil_post_rev_8_21_14_2_50_50_13]PIV31435.1 MAG: peptidase M16 [Zetaproteobacteria bacterium CG02_land_8_20_14_3_00_50_9]PIY55042.1 MAG: peptidase M16 [Zetaproteobacteria bacterium CG_4_10_14_0_8_um_filter_49_80]PJA36507.1 MAG: peptidase M16 [Zetaproteobacteria bacterium CG_4_9_14_3_um_filter_49_83]
MKFNPVTQSSFPLPFLTLLIGLLLPFYAEAIPQIQEQSLPNGVRVLLVEAHNIPMVSMQITLPAGSRFDQHGKGGSASLLAEMLTDHTALHDDKQWALWLDSEAMRIGSGADRDTLQLSMTVLRESLGTGIQAVSEALLHPGWKQQRFDLIRKNAVDGATKALEDPGTQTAEATASLLYADHPYGHRSPGTAESLARIQLPDLQRLYSEQIKPQGSVIAISGDTTMQEIISLLQPRLKDWVGVPSVAAMAIAEPPLVLGQNNQISMPTSQVQLQYSRLGIARSSKDFFPLFVLNHILGGGGFGSRLMEEVREKRGLVYGVYSYFMPLLAPGPFIISLQTKASQADDADLVVRDVLDQMRHGAITEKQLSDSKKNLIGSFAQRLDSNRERVGLIGMIGFYHLPLDYLQQWVEQVNAVSLANVKIIAQDWLDPDAWNLVETGPYSIANPSHRSIKP